MNDTPDWIKQLQAERDGIEPDTLAEWIRGHDNALPILQNIVHETGRLVAQFAMLHQRLSELALMVQQQEQKHGTIDTE